MSKFTTVVKGIQNTFTLELNYDGNHSVKYSATVVKGSQNTFTIVLKLWCELLMIHHQGSNPDYYHQRWSVFIILAKLKLYNMKKLHTPYTRQYQGTWGVRTRTTNYYQKWHTLICQNCTRGHWDHRNMLTSNPRTPPKWSCYVITGELSNPGSPPK